MADVGCRSALHAHAYHLARVISRRPSIVRGAGVHARGVPGLHARSTAGACQDTDAPYRTLRHAGPGTLAKAVTVAAGAPIMGAGAALAYRALVAAPVGGVSSSAWPDLSQQSAFNYVPSLPFAAPMKGNTPQGLSLVPPAAAPRADVPTAVPEPSSALLLVPVLLAFVLARRAGLRRRRAWSVEQDPPRTRGAPASRLLRPVPRDEGRADRGRSHPQGA